MRRKPAIAVWVAYSLALACAALAFAHALSVSDVCDDAAISLAYARDLARGAGLRLTPFSARVEAYSDPLWVLWLFAGFALHLARETGARFAALTGCALGGASAFLLALVPSRAAGRSPTPLDVLPAALLALNTTFALWVGSGLETGAFACALSALLYVLAGERAPARGAITAGLLAGVLAVLRPEGILYVIAYGILRAGLEWNGDRNLRGRLSFWAAAFSPVAVWLAVRRAYYGDWLPNSYYAKVNWHLAGGGLYLAGWFESNPVVYGCLILFPAAVIAKRTRRAALLALPAIACATFFIYWSGGDWMTGYRFTAHALPAVALLLGLIPAAIVECLPRKRRSAMIAGTAAVALAIAASIVAARELPRRRGSMDMKLAPQLWYGRFYAQTLHRLRLEYGRVATFDIGAVALESGADVIDLAGLADARIAQELRHGRKGQVANDLFDVLKPDLINVHGPSAYLVSDPRLRRDYRVLRSDAGSTDFVRASLERGDDDRCPGGLAASLHQAMLDPAALAAQLERDHAAGQPALLAARFLCARAHLPASALPMDFAVRLGQALEREGLREPNPTRAEALLFAAVALDPQAVAATLRLAGR